MIVVYETFDKFDLRKIKLLFENKNISYKVLHEYRVFEEKLFELETAHEPAQLLVNRKDFLAANYILQNNGFKEYINPKAQKFEFYKRFEKITEKLPLLNKIHGSYRLIISAGVFFIAIISTLLFYNSLILPNDLKGQFWCVEFIEYKGEKILHTDSHTCNDLLRISSNGIVSFPDGNKARSRLKAKRKFEVTSVE